MDSNFGYGLYIEETSIWKLKNSAFAKILHQLNNRLFYQKCTRQLSYSQRNWF